MKIVYIASAYKIGDVARNVAVSMDAAHVLMDWGFAPICPLLSHFLHIHRQRPERDWVKVDLSILEKADYFVRLPGKSLGADREEKHAKKLGIPCYYTLASFYQQVVTQLKTPIDYGRKDREQNRAYSNAGCTDSA